MLSILNEFCSLLMCVTLPWSSVTSASKFFPYTTADLVPLASVVNVIPLSLAICPAKLSFQLLLNQSLMMNQSVFLI